MVQSMYVHGEGETWTDACIVPARAALMRSLFADRPGVVEGGAMKVQSYWMDTVPRYEPRVRDWPGSVDVAIVGAGFTGLSAALALAARGAKVPVLEPGHRVASEADGRNGRHVNHRVPHDYVELPARVGVQQTRAGYRANDAAVDRVDRLGRETKLVGQQLGELLRRIKRHLVRPRG